MGKVLREFVASLKAEMDEFRLSAIRELRNITNGFSDLIED